jgi:hypothetical protein
MDQRDLLSFTTTRCILVFFENTLNSFKRKPTLSRIRWFENFRDYLDVNELGYANSKLSGDYTEEIIFWKMQDLEPSVKSWLLELAIEMLNVEREFDFEDVRVTASRISKALNIPESDFYNMMTTKTAEIDGNLTKRNGKLEAKRTIHYSKYKTTAIFYSSGEHVIEIFENDTFTLTAPSGKKYDYEIINTVQERNDFFFFLKNPRSKALGYFKMMPLGRAEFKFDIGNLVKLKM